MKKAILVIMGLALIMWQVSSAAPAKADYFNYPCPPAGNGQGIGADINFIVDASGQFCDGPTEINLSHAHCEAGGATVNFGAIALAPIGGATLGGIGGGGTGGSGQGCSYRCPDNTVAPQPNPPGVGSQHYIDVRAIIKLNKAFCVREGHLTPAGPTSALVSPDEGFPPTKDVQPYQIGDSSVEVPGPNAAPAGVPKPAENPGTPPEGPIEVPEQTPAVTLPGPLPSVPAVPLPQLPQP